MIHTGQPLGHTGQPRTHWSTSRTHRSTSRTHWSTSDTQVNLGHTGQPQTHWSTSDTLVNLSDTQVNLGHTGQPRTHWSTSDTQVNLRHTGQPQTCAKVQLSCAAVQHFYMCAYASCEGSASVLGGWEIFTSTRDGLHVTSLAACIVFTCTWTLYIIKSYERLLG